MPSTSVFTAIVDNSSTFSDAVVLQKSRNVSEGQLLCYADHDAMGIFSDFDEAMAAAYDCGRRLMLGLSLGSWVPTHVIDSVVARFTEDMFLVGHLLDKGSSYFELYRQAFVIDVAKWHQHGRPSYYKTSGSFQNAERSSDNFHDDYTSVWLRSGVGQQYYDKASNGSALIDVGLRFFRVSPFTRSERRHKFYCYGNRPQESRMRFRGFENRLNLHRQDFYSTATERTRPYKGSLRFNCYVGVASSLHPIVYLKTLFPDIESLQKIVLFDYSGVALAFSEQVLLHADLNNYDVFVEDFCREHGVPNSRHKSSDVRAYFENICTVFGGKEYLLEFLSVIRTRISEQKVSVTTLQVDLLAWGDAVSLANMLEEDDVAAIHLSNVFDWPRCIGAVGLLDSVFAARTFCKLAEDRASCQFFGHVFEQSSDLYEVAARIVELAPWLSSAELKDAFEAGNKPKGPKTLDRSDR